MELVTESEESAGKADTLIDGVMVVPNFLFVRQYCSYQSHAEAPWDKPHLRLDETRQARMKCEIIKTFRNIGRIEMVDTGIRRPSQSLAAD